jgi:hypothetical protein
VILTAHLDTVAGTKPTDVKVSGHLARGIGGMLGADDRAGVALILWLASLGISEPRGVGYALFLGEESGCVGAGEALAAGVFPEARVMLSLDRRGTGDLVIAQAGQPTASREAGWWLAEQLGMNHRLVQGVWTDSAAFAGVIPECFNVSVGYEGAHTDNDTQDLCYLNDLGYALLGVEWEGVPVVRETREVWRQEPRQFEEAMMEGEWRKQARVRAVMERLQEWDAVEDMMEAVLEEFPAVLEYLEWLTGGK